MTDVAIFITTLTIADNSITTTEVFANERRVYGYLRERFEAPVEVSDFDLIQWVIDNAHVELYISEHALQMEVKFL